MRRSCPLCNYHWAWELNDNRFKCPASRGNRYTFHLNVWNAYRLSHTVKTTLLDYFVLGVPAYRLRFKDMAAQSTIEKFYRSMRGCMATAEDCHEPFTGEIECDETMFGGKRKGKRGWGAAGKIIVLGILKRNGAVKVFPVQGRSAETLIPLIRASTTPGSLYYTDDWHAYGSLSVRGGHVVVHKEKGIPKGRDHINGIEGFWSYAKHWLYQYRGVSKKFFHLYLGELSYRFNHRDQDLYPLIYALLRQLSTNQINLF